ncbi:MAG: metal ABC transporter permease [Nitrososphaeraceae archaeon]|nr:metal ABC transporter permease [Nitrososphaeraceae archaeon]MBV9667011.1 metal ABC transporter permease [Nitrososphaeraceae archaeon]
MIFEILQYGFMQRALISGVAVAITCSAIGLFLVLRQQSLFADGLSHMAFGGIAIGLFTNLYPIWTALIVSILAALGITRLRESTKMPPDSAIAVLLSTGLAIGVILIGLAGGFTLDLYSFLFGSILLISIQDQETILLASAVILSILYFFYQKLIYVTFDEEQAKVSGINVSRLNYLFVILASISVIVSVRLVGVLLISSLIVIPNITAIMFGKGFKKTALISLSIAVLSVLLGVIISYIMNLAPGGTIVITSVTAYLVAMTTKYFKKKIVMWNGVARSSRTIR